MPVYNRITEFEDDMRAWRHEIHRHPELCFEEVKTAAIVADKLKEWGIETHEGIAKTGVVGVIKGQGSSTRSIGIRADMDALPMQEVGSPSYKSVEDGKMHACGHDGHTAILLGAAKYLAETRNFDGTVNVIFQPAEEGGAGGDLMVKEGLFDRFECDAVYGLHNLPNFPKGTFNIRHGALMAAADSVKITINGVGGHAAMPQMSKDPIAVGVQIYNAAQAILTRNVDPIHMAVISITQFHAGTAGNVIPDTAFLNASVRTTDPATRDLIERRMGEICTAMAAMHEVEIEFVYKRGYPATVNHDDQVDRVVRAAEAIVGPDMVNANCDPVMGSEDFSYMLEARPGAYIFLGGGDETHVHSVHHPEFDFNDETLTIGSSLWAKLVEQEMPRDG
ncbi:MAG: amidohydrolase [Rhodospirillaceae bacterium]|jgi:amidohydrolase|nr:amidohydrolase [Rhodospirillaceae bacterium]MBT6138639.1 amidohydrolase [Rhodospirillaceae bacterium]